MAFAIVVITGVDCTRASEDVDLVRADNEEEEEDEDEEEDVVANDEEEQNVFGLLARTRLLFLPSFFD